MHDLVNVYPLRLVTHLHQAAHLNRRSEMVLLANVVSIGVSHSLDLALDKGKGKVLERFADLMLEAAITVKKRRPAMSERAASFFGSLPAKKAVHGN